MPKRILCVSRRLRALAPAVLWAAWLATPADVGAASPAPPSITIQVKQIHCASCGQKLASKLYTAPGVVKVTTDVKTARALVWTEPRKTPSPRALWELVEAGGCAPVKLTSPQGVFTSKPAE